MDRLDRRGGLFLDWAFVVFGEVNGAGEGNCRRIAHRLSVDRYRPAQRPLCLCWDGKEEMGGEVPAIARPDWPPTGFAGAHFPPATDSPVRAIWPSAWPAPPVLLPSLGSKGGIGLQGLSSLDC